MSSGGRSVDGYNFLELMEDEGDKEKEERREMRKRVDEIKIEIRQTGMKNVPGWEGRSERERGDEKWRIERHREAMGTGEKITEVGHVLVPDGFDLGLDKRGPLMNNSNRKNNLMGNGRVALFPKERGGEKLGGNFYQGRVCGM
jgi:hypothetical protein